MNQNQNSGSESVRFLALVAYLVVSGSIFLAVVGCGTTTTRKATEQLLMSDAVDNAIAQIDFHALQGQKVYIDTSYLGDVPGIGFVNSNYIISSLRQQLAAADCLIQDDRNAAAVVIEPRVGALGTDIHEIVYGVPQSGALNAAAALTSSPIPAIPEISFGKSNAQTGIAKMIVFAYDRETRQAIWQSGVAKAESTSQNNWYLGAGPFQKGTIHDGTRFAGQSFPFEKKSFRPSPVPTNDETETDKSFVPFNQPFVFDRINIIDDSQPPTDLSSEDVQRASHEKTLED